VTYFEVSGKPIGGLNITFHSKFDLISGVSENIAMKSLKISIFDYAIDIRCQFPVNFGESPQKPCMTRNYRFMSYTLLL